MLKVLGNLDIVTPDGVSPAEASALDRYARRTSDLVWRLDRGRLPDFGRGSTSPCG